MSTLHVMPLRLRVLLVLLFVVALVPGARPVAAEEALSLAVNAGVFNVSKEEKVGEAGLSVRIPTKAWKLTVEVGGAANADGAFYIFSGLRRDFSLSRGWRITPGFGISIYEQGDGKNLGGPVEFRSIVDFSYQWRNDHRLSAGMYHLSNAGIYDRNPGANSVIVTYSFQLGGAAQPEESP